MITAHAELPTSTYCSTCTKTDLPTGRTASKLEEQISKMVEAKVAAALAKLTEPKPPDGESS